MKIIDNWKQAHKFLTVQISTLLGMAAAAYEYFPAMREYFPEGWAKYAFAAIIVARLWKQKGL
jgi:hypothetical protein